MVDIAKLDENTKLFVFDDILYGACTPAEGYADLLISSGIDPTTISESEMAALIRALEEERANSRFAD